MLAFCRTLGKYRGLPAEAGLRKMRDQLSAKECGTAGFIPQILTRQTRGDLLNCAVKEYSCSESVQACTERQMFDFIRQEAANF